MGTGSTSGSTVARKHSLLAAVGAAVLGVVVGAVAVSATQREPDPTESSQYQALADDLAKTEADLADVEVKLSDTEAASVSVREQLAETATELNDLAGNLPEREAQLARDRAALAKATNTVRSAEREVAAREEAVGITETRIANNTVGGNGVYSVGPEGDMAAGTYRTSGRQFCYYAVLSAPNSTLDNIVTNSNNSGPGIVTLAAGQYFETSNCAQWTLAP